MKYELNKVSKQAKTKYHFVKQSDIMNDEMRVLRMMMKAESTVRLLVCSLNAYDQKSFCHSILYVSFQNKMTLVRDTEPCCGCGF